jgi:uncharacterized membrane protein YecN with MAPEG domain
LRPPTEEIVLTTALVCTALLGLLIFALGFGVSTIRGRNERTIGYDSDPKDPLHKIVRAHGNSTEYAPIFAVLMMALGALNPAAWVGWVMGAAVASRYLIVAGLLTGSLDKPNPMRFIGALGTYLTGFALCVALILAI